MAELIYLNDSYVKEYETVVTSVSKQNDDTLFTLRETVFYPYGGGQPSDTGTLTGRNGTLEVAQVSYNNGDPIHRGKLIGRLAVGDRVTCRIDWDRRYQNMQVHSAGHVIHEAVRLLVPGLIPIKGDHGKHPYIIYKGVISPDLKDKLEQKANQIVKDDLEITTKFVSASELQKIVPDVPDNLPGNKELRIIQLGQFPPTPDGGTQVGKTGEIPPVTILSIENESGNATIHYRLEKEVLKEVKPGKSEAETQKHPVAPEVEPDEIIDFKNNAVSLLTQAGSLAELEQIQATLLGKNGKIAQLLKNLPQLAREDRKSYGIALNSAKNAIVSAIDGQKPRLAAGPPDQVTDITLPGTPIPVGLLHPITAVAREINEIFHGLGFSVADGPELETDEYNYNRLNLPMDHPARDLQDSLYIKEPNLLLRTHTSSVEAHILAECKPPYRFVFPGKCYRYENVNATNHMMFYQYQGLAIGENITLANLKSTFETFLRLYYGEDVLSRFRCKYYPEVEPGVGVDVNCPFCNFKGCSVCKFRGWIEISGAGVVHPNLLRRANLDPAKYSGFAFGMGLDRLAMTRYGIKDIRTLFNGDLVYQI